MPESHENTASRKTDHLSICLNKDVAFKKSSGFENYEFINNAVTQLDYKSIDLSTNFFERRINYPFLISCMTGGVDEAEGINSQLAEAAEELKIPIGVGSQRQALENNKFIGSYKILKEKADKVPILGNIGAAQIASKLSVEEIQRLMDMIGASALVIHFNAAQELFQKKGDTNFTNLLNSVEELVKKVSIPVIAKEVGFGIEKHAAKRLLEVGIKCIDVAGAGGTSWSAVEMLRNNNVDEYFWNWGLPTSYCIRKVSKLKSKFDFVLIGSGGITNGVELAKAIALGADIGASARPVLLELNENGVKGVVKTLLGWFETLRKIMFLTGSNRLDELKKDKILKKEDLF